MNAFLALTEKHARAQARPPSKRLENGSPVAVIGGGPAGSFFSYFLLDLAERVGLTLRVDIYEPRDFALPAPQGCNMCAGVISETLVQNLATEGITLPAAVIQQPINSYVLHTNVGNQRLDAASHEKRIAAIFRGGGPHGAGDAALHGFDAHLLALARDKGARTVRSRVTGVERGGDRLQVHTREGQSAPYDLLVVAAGVNTAALKLCEAVEPRYDPPETTRTAIREYRLGKAAVDQYLGDALHVFLLDIPKLDFAMFIPKGDYVSVCMLGRDIDDGLLRAFLTAPEVTCCFPEGWQWDRPACQCAPRINVHGALQPFGDRVVFIGDSGVTRLYKDGIGAAYRSAKAAAACAILAGVSEDDFRRHYAPFCSRLASDNRFGRVLFFITHVIQRVRLSRKAVLRMAAAERGSSLGPARMGSVLWDTFTGSAPYRDVLLRTLHPAFAGRFGWSLVASAIGR